MDKYCCKKEYFRDMGRLYYGDIRNSRHDFYIENDNEIMEVFFLPYATGSDYSGDTVTRCNHDVFLELTEENNWYGVRDCYGGYDTYGIVLSEPATRNPEIKEILDGLENYPLIDDEALSFHELELEQENWEAWANDDFKDLLEKALGAEDSRISVGAFRKLFLQACEDSNTYAQFETGQVLYWDFDRIVPSAVEIINSFLPPLTQDRREKLAGQLFL